MSIKCIKCIIVGNNNLKNLPYNVRVVSTYYYIVILYYYSNVTIVLILYNDCYYQC